MFAYTEIKKEIYHYNRNFIAVKIQFFLKRCGY